MLHCPPDAIFTRDDLRGMVKGQGLELTDDAIRREIKSGRLKAYRRVGRDYFVGSDIMAWLKGGERSPSASDFELEVDDPHELSTRGAS